MNTNKTYTKNDIRKMAGQSVLAAMQNHNAFAYRSELQKQCDTILQNEMTKDTYTKDEMLAIIGSIDDAVYDYLDH